MKTESNKDKRNPEANCPERIDLAIKLVEDELLRACSKFPAFRSPHEGYAIILEEVREMEREVFLNWTFRSVEEAIQVAAMATRFVADYISED